jgi:hypothetical protein
MPLFTQRVGEGGRRFVNGYATLLLIKQGGRRNLDEWASRRGMVPPHLYATILASGDEFRMNRRLRGVSRAAAEGLNEGSHHALASLTPPGVTMRLLALRAEGVFSEVQKLCGT